MDNVNSESSERFDQFKKIFNTNMNMLPDYLLDLNYEAALHELECSILDLKNNIGIILLPIINNIDYLNLLLNEKFVNYNLKGGNFKISEFESDCGLNELGDILEIANSMNFRITNNEDKEIIYGSIIICYDKIVDYGSIQIDIEDFISKYLLDEDFDFTLLSIKDKYKKLSLIKNNVFTIVDISKDIMKIIGDIYSYASNVDNRSVFIIK